MEEIKAPIKARIKEFLKKKKITYVQCALNTGLSEPLLKNKTSEFSGKSLSKIFNAYPDLNRKWALEGIGDMEIKDVKENNDVMIHSIEVSQILALKDKLLEQARSEIAAKDKLLEAYEKNIELLEEKNARIEEKIANNGKKNN